MEGLGKMLITLGLVLVLFGILFTFSGKLFGLGRLPGDILVRRGNFTFYFPVVTSLVLSVALSLFFLLVNLFLRRR